ncbi:gliding motility lipoprotein GldB [Tenacibaculum finnmarkense]|uniref:Gliding motility lipoprotein GldB n=1 Tax=Tenacibaculum finnmarkense genomovar finnmarkense TaxID=1458503 RepID=A0AAP1RHJ6_9FLAO|nr:gliding motility lipoprotein GldB [Tenacibaculum finnmarkense]MBE7653763.1 gliding motility lipoprotein GldB [Tenacibaculum finnmarkense genomovar finnmarkense]MBE7696048.1 gliding motility lipoprotein GldB [Tenacibaculum finnmarkense genomovar finnmarkense]MCD8428276.1 gliding motility lipoprotein GldB [Tenacibaculum finnmarkense genomovar finnmarkense]MCD8440495.1 gliding motility lipoprotein GldB [Tenacibaculum finnmarkense genomovar ulcerans]MCG8721396.1 gliding motility lipoprotein Gld
MRKFLALCVLVLAIISCKKEINSKLKVDVSNIKVNVKIDRFDVDFYKTTPADLGKTKLKYPFLFPQEPDSVWINKINNKDERELYDETQKVFSNITGLTTDLNSFFKHLKYYNPKAKTPRVITMLTNIDYDNRIVFADSLLLISLDAYLGKKHPFYSEYPAYIKQNNEKEQVIVDVAKAILNAHKFSKKPRSFVDKMIYKGKKMYLLDAYLPAVSDSLKIGYSQNKMRWAESNEAQIWKYFIEKNMLYNTDKELDIRFLDIAPFSKFYLEKDRQSPGRIGEFIGWQIVRSYMQKNDVSLPELLQKNEAEIFIKSNYKPKK